LIYKDELDNEFYDMDADTYQQNNLSTDKPVGYSSMLNELLQIVSNFRRIGEKAQSGDEELLKELENLGYIQ